VYHCQRRASQLDKINDMPLYPTEKVSVGVACWCADALVGVAAILQVIWDENVVPTEYYSWEGEHNY